MAVPPITMEYMCSNSSSNFNHEGRLKLQWKWKYCVIFVITTIITISNSQTPPDGDSVKVTFTPVPGTGKQAQYFYCDFELTSGYNFSALQWQAGSTPMFAQLINFASPEAAYSGRIIAGVDSGLDLPSNFIGQGRHWMRVNETSVCDQMMYRCQLTFGDSGPLQLSDEQQLNYDSPVSCVVSINGESLTAGADQCEANVLSTVNVSQPITIAADVTNSKDAVFYTLHLEDDGGKIINVVIDAPSNTSSSDPPTCTVGRSMTGTATIEKRTHRLKLAHYCNFCFTFPGAPAASSGLVDWEIALIIIGIIILIVIVAVLVFFIFKKTQISCGVGPDDKEKEGDKKPVAYENGAYVSSRPSIATESRVTMSVANEKQGYEHLDGNHGDREDNYGDVHSDANSYYGNPKSSRSAGAALSSRQNAVPLTEIEESNTRALPPPPRLQPLEPLEPHDMDSARQEKKKKRKKRRKKRESNLDEEPKEE